MGLLKKYHQIRNHFNLRRYLKLYPLTCSGSADSFNFASLRHLVISKMDGKLGDCQVITAFICNLKQQFPKLRITVICPQNVAAIFTELLQVQVVQIPPRAEPAAVKQAVAAGDLLHYPCDALLSTEPNFRGRDFCLHSLLQPKFLIGIETMSGTVNLNLLQRNLGRHISLWFEDLLTLGGAEIRQHEYLPLFSARLQQQAQELLGPGCIGIAPWGASRHRRLGDQCIVELIELIRDNSSFNPVLLFDPQPDLLAACRKKAGERLRLKPEGTSVMQFAALIASCELLVSVDSAPVHLANGSRTPVFGIYSGHDPEGIIRWGPAPFAVESRVFYKEGRKIDRLSLADFKAELLDFVAVADWEKPPAGQQGI